MDVGRWPAIWLRDNCPCPDCRVPGSGQKLFQITELPDELAVTAVEEDADSVTETFGYVRETNYGRVFDVRVEATPANLASTGLALSPHTDNPYRDPVPTIQLLHCQASAADGGDTLLVDGFAAAHRLRVEDPRSSGVLTRTPVPFGYPLAGLRAYQPLIELSPEGRIRGIRFNNRSLQALRRPPGEVTAFYVAYRRWAALLARPELALTLRLAPGDCLIFDNTRVLHGRTAFTGSGDRLLQGCYADLDALAGTLALLNETALAENGVMAGGSGGRDR